MTRRMVAAVSQPATNVLGHCTGRLVEGKRGKRAAVAVRRRDVFARLRRARRRRRDQLAPERCDPPDELIELALDARCLFSIDSDAHAPGQLDMKASAASAPSGWASRPSASSRRGRVEEVRAWAKG